MACYSPWQASTVPGSPVRFFSCGKCHGCRLEYARQWGVRCMHEASLHDSNCFITLTYGHECWSLDYSDFQRFMKRLRARFRARIRYYMCGEYQRNSRPHFHALLFGFDFADKRYFKMSESGCRVYTSDVLASLWPAGFSSVGSLTFESASYVARYCMKKISNYYDDDELFEIIDPDSGEVFRRKREFAHMSRNLAKEWFLRYKDDVYPHGEVVVNGKEVAPPKAYDRWFRATNAGAWMELCQARAVRVAERLAESAPSRLAAREAVSKAGLRKGSL